MELVLFHPSETRVRKPFKNFVIPVTLEQQDHTVNTVSFLVLSVRSCSIVLIIMFLHFFFFFKHFQRQNTENDINLFK